MSVNDITNFNFYDLTTPTSESDAYDQCVELVQSQTTEITDYSVGSLVDCWARMVARMMSIDSNDTAAITLTTYPSYARGDSLTQAAGGFYSLQRTDPSPAVRSMVFNLALPYGPYTINPGEQQVQDQGGNVFYNTNVITLNSLTQSCSGTMQCISSGTMGNSLQGTLSLVGTLAGVTVSDNGVVTYGIAQENDTKLRTAATTQFAQLQNGEVTQDSLTNLVVKNPSTNDLTFVSIYGKNPNGPGTAVVYISGDDFVATSDDATNVQNDIVNKIFLGCSGSSPRVQVVPAQPLVLPLTGTIWYTGDLATVQSNVNSALTSWVKTIPIGGFSYPEINPLIGIVFYSDVDRILDDVPGIVKYMINAPASGYFQNVPSGKLVSPQTLSTGSQWTDGLGFIKIST